MIKIEMLLFGITTDLLGTSSLNIEVPINATISTLKTQLLANHPQLENIDSYAIAVNEEYASNETVLKENDIVAIIPPVSGG
jgi:molybdopterin converting factor subunit 1